MGEPEQPDQPPLPVPPDVAAYLRNMSPRVLRLQGHGSELVLPPLYEVRLTQAQLDEFDVDLLKTNPYLELDTGDVDQDEINATVLGAAAWLALIVAIVVGTVTDNWIWGVVAFVAVIIGGFLVRGAVRKGTSWTGASRWVREKAALLLVLVIGFGLPATVLLFGTGLFDALRNDVGDALDAPLNQVVTYRALQVVFLGLATCFPALMYFQFDRQHLDTLRDRFLLALFRLDLTIDTAHDWDARYGKQISETIGKLRRGSLTSLFRSRRSPVVVATLVIAVGWLLAFLNLDAVDDSGTSDVLVGGSLIKLFEPERGVVAFGFLGAYFFGVNAVLRSYLRGDLRPKAYNQITARILIVVVLSSLLSITTLGDEAVVLGLAFFAGIIPDTVLQFIAEQLPIKSSRVDETEPLTDLEGIDIYDRARLAEEGVTNMEALAHGDLIELLLQTRIPPQRLVDWVDQAILRVHIGDPQLTSFGGLRQLGIRGATDLINARDKCDLPTALGLDATGQVQLEVLVQSVLDSEWVTELLAWREHARPIERVIDCRPVLGGAAVVTESSVTESSGAERTMASPPVGG